MVWAMLPGPAHAPDEPRPDRPDGDETFGFRAVSAEEKPGLVRAVFDSVAPSYDLMNDLMSGGLHRLWKADLARRMDPKPGMHLVDVAGGTGDVAFRFLDRAKEPAKDGAPAHATVVDTNPNMIEVGRARAIDRGRLSGLDWAVGDASALPLADGVADTYSIVFGIRNVTGREAALAEARRVLKPGGRFFCLEFGRLPAGPLGRLYDTYSFAVVPLVGQVVTGDGDAYRYLVESIRCFPEAGAFSGMVSEAGLDRVRVHRLSGGIVNLFTAWRL